MTKRRKAFRWFHCQKADIVFLQETFSSCESITFWENEYGGKIYANHGTKHSKGVAILFNPKLDFTLESIQKDANGRAIVLSIVIDGSRFVLANIYSPNDQNAQVRFYKSIFLMLDPFANKHIILGGDFNCCMSNDDKNGGTSVTSKQSVIKEIYNLIKSFKLKDIWRQQHPNAKDFTWRNSNKRISCRLDYLYISKSLVNNYTKSDIITTTIADHSAVTVLLASNLSSLKRGPGFWKFNNSLLKENEFIDSLQQKIPKFLEQYSYLDDKGLLWEMVKMEIRAFTISYSKHKAALKRQHEKELLRKLNELQRKVDCNFSTTVNEELNFVKQNLDKVTDAKVNGCIIRSKCRWYEFGERNSKYFFNLEKRNYSKNYISLLKDDADNNITNPDAILKQEKRYYENLYKTTSPNPSECKFSVFFENESLPTISQEEKTHCEGLFSKLECLLH